PTFPTTILHSNHAPRTFHCKASSTSEIYTLSLHDALPISSGGQTQSGRAPRRPGGRRRYCSQQPTRGSVSSSGSWPATVQRPTVDRKSTRLNSSHVSISYAVFCLKKKKEQYETVHRDCYYA